MAFEDEYEAPRPAAKPRDGPITTWDSNPLFTFLAQLGSGIILLLSWGSSLLILPLIIAYMPPTGPVNPVGLVVMILFVPFGLVQVYLAYRLYKRTARTLNLSFLSGLFVIIMSATILVTGFITGTMADIRLPLAQIALNIVLVYLTTLGNVKAHFEGASQEPLY